MFNVFLSPRKLSFINIYGSSGISKTFVFNCPKRQKEEGGMKNLNILASDAFHIPNQICFLSVALHFISSVLSLNLLAPKM